MAFNYSPKIVTDGLVLYLDAANLNSYVSGSTAWRDISRGGNNGTLINGPTFNSANGGSIVFDGVDDYLLTQTITSYKTLCFWINWVDTAAAWEYLVDARPGMNSGWFVPSTTSQGSDWNSTFYVNGVAKTGCNVTNVPPNTWLYLCLEGINSSYTSTINFMSRYTNAEFASGNISCIQIYNRALSATEVRQNYNATKTRFGLT